MNFTTEQLQILKKANITKDRYQNCYFDINNTLFIGTQDKTGEEVYQDWFKNKDNTIKEATEQEKLLSILMSENAEIKEQLKEQQELCSNLMLQIAELREEKVNV